MFCRYCGVNIPDDSLFCLKCGKRLAAATGNPRLQRLVERLWLKTPYPYFAILFILFVAWAVGPRQTRADYSHTRWTLEVDRQLDLPEENLFQQSLSLVVENTGTTPLQEIPIELSAHIDPQKPAEVIAGFLGRRLVIMESGKPLPLVLVLSDRVEPGQKRRYLLEGSIQAEPPFRLTYEVREQDSDTVLTSHIVEP